MDWYDVRLDKGEAVMIHFGQTTPYGRAIATPVLDQATDRWRIHGTWDVTFRIAIDRRNIDLSEYYRDHAIIDALEFFQRFQHRDPTDDEKRQLQEAVDRYLDTSDVKRPTLDAVWGHELMHVAAVEAAVAFDTATGELGGLARQAKKAEFVDEIRARLYADEWETRVMIRLRQMSRRGGDHDHAGLVAAVGGVIGAMLPGLRVAIAGGAPPAASAVFGAHAPPPTGDGQAWEQEKLNLQLARYFPITTDPVP